MAVLRCYEVNGESVAEMLEDFNSRDPDDLGVTQKTLVSVNVITAPPGSKHKVTMFMTYWADE